MAFKGVSLLVSIRRMAGVLAEKRCLPGWGVGGLAFEPVERQHRRVDAKLCSATYSPVVSRKSTSCGQVPFPHLRSDR